MSDPTGKKVKLDYGLEVFNRYNGKYDLQLQQYYADVSWWYFKLHAGARRETFGNQYDPLSSGSLLYSGNARPIPKVAVFSNLAGAFNIWNTDDTDYTDDHGL